MREARDLSVRQLARLAGLDATGISRLEHANAKAPAPRTLARLAEALRVHVADLYAAAGYEPAHELPAFQPYLRAKYDLPPEAIAQLAAHFDLIDARYRTQGGEKGGVGPT